MHTRRRIVSALLVPAGLGLWLLLAGPDRLLGIDTGNVGVVLLMGAVWVSLWAIGRLPRGTLDTAVSPGEWKAWVGTVFMAIGLVYFLSNLHVFGAGRLRHNPEAAVVGRHLALLLVAWAILSGVMASRWKGQVEADERDREIACTASAWGRGALTGALVVLAVTLAFLPDERLHWATPLMIANQLIAALMLAGLVEYAVGAVHYWRDRH